MAGPNIKKCVIIPLNGRILDTANTFAFDCVLNETHSEENVITEFPVENIDFIADNIRRSPTKVTLQGIVAEQGVNDASVFDNTSDRIAKATEVIEKMVSAKTVFHLSTSYKRYENMAIATTSVARSSTTGSVIDLTVNLKKIQSGTTQNVVAPKPKTPRATKTKDKGLGQTADAPSPKDANKSLIRKIGEFGLEQMKATDPLSFLKGTK